jgi:hypothetical protein
MPLSSGFEFRLLPNLFFTYSTHSGLSVDISLVQGLKYETCLAFFLAFCFGQINYVLWTIYHTNYDIILGK